MTPNQMAIIGHVLMQIAPGAVVDEKIVKNYIDVFKMLNPISDKEEDELIKELHSQLSIRMDHGACVKEKNHVSWYYDAKKEIQ